MITKLNLSILVFSVIVSLNTFSQQTSENVKMISETADQVVVNLSPDEDTIDRQLVDKLVNSYYSVVGINDVELTENGNLRVTYLRSKLNGPGIFIGLAKEHNFYFAELIEQ